MKAKTGPEDWPPFAQECWRYTQALKHELEWHPGEPVEVWIKRRERVLPRSRAALASSWNRLRKEALGHYPPVCVACGWLSDLQVDHIRAWKTCPERYLDFSNLQILCGDCNRLKRDHPNYFLAIYERIRRGEIDPTT